MQTQYSDQAALACLQVAWFEWRTYAALVIGASLYEMRQASLQISEGARRSDLAASTTKLTCNGPELEGSGKGQATGGPQQEIEICVRERIEAIEARPLACGTISGSMGKL